MEKEHMHGYITSIDTIDIAEKEELFDLCESLINSEDLFFENRKWIIKKSEINSDIKVENKITKAIFQVWVDLNKSMENAMAEYGKWQDEYYGNIQRVNNRIIKAIKSVKGKKFEKNFIDLVTELEIGGNFWSFTGEPCGSPQNESYGLIKQFWVDQWRDGGYTGDDFAGDIYIKLKDKKFLKMGYEC